MQIHEVEHVAVDGPRHDDARGDEREFLHRAPRLGAFEPPRTAFAPCDGATGRHARQEIDGDEAEDARYQRHDGGEPAGQCGRLRR